MLSGEKRPGAHGDRRSGEATHGTRSAAEVRGSRRGAPTSGRPGRLRPARLPGRGGDRRGRHRHVGRGHGTQLRAGRDRPLPGPRHRRTRQAVPGQARQHADPAALHRHPVGRGLRLVRHQPLPGVERHPACGEPALARGGRPCRPPLPRLLAPQQRQHLRFRGPADQLLPRARQRHPLRVGRHRHRARDRVRGAALQRPQRRHGAPRRRLDLVHRPGLRGADELRGQALRRHNAAAVPQGGGLPDRPQRHDHAGSPTRSTSPTGSASAPTTRRSTWPTPAPATTPTSCRPR